mgnify:CR=1 FL=1
MTLSPKDKKRIQEITKRLLAEAEDLSRLSVVPGNKLLSPKSSRVNMNATRWEDIGGEDLDKHLNIKTVAPEAIYQDPIEAQGDRAEKIVSSFSPEDRKIFDNIVKMYQNKPLKDIEEEIENLKYAISKGRTWAIPLLHELEYLLRSRQAY